MKSDGECEWREQTGKSRNSGKGKGQQETGLGQSIIMQKVPTSQAAVLPQNEMKTHLAIKDNQQHLVLISKIIILCN